MISTAARRASDFFPLFFITVIGLAVAIAWDISGQDVALAHLFGGTPNGFPFRSNWFAENVLHEDARRLGWLIEVWLCVGVGWPTWILLRLQRSERVELALISLLALLSVSMIKTFSHTSCPWDLKEFGGVATYVSHWALGVRDGGPGACFPAGHASAGFCFLGGYFVWRKNHPRIAAVWLAASLFAGFFLGLVQQFRGAHYMSHTLWTCWLCWTTGWLIDLVWQRSKHLFTIRRGLRTQP